MGTAWYLQETFTGRQQVSIGLSGVLSHFATAGPVFINDLLTKRLTQDPALPMCGTSQVILSWAAATTSVDV
jgi:hypothetical protein